MRLTVPSTPRTDCQATLEALAGGEDASDAFYAQRVAVRDTADLKRARELAAFGRDAVRVLDGVGGGRKGKGVGSEFSILHPHSPAVRGCARARR